MKTEKHNHALAATANPWLFNQHNVRTALDDYGNPWFCAKDVFDALDIAWKGTGTSLRNYPEEWICTLQLRGQSGSGEVVFISEPAVYRVLFRSDKPQAIDFANWVCAEVLPALRRQGFYGAASAKEQLQLTALMLRLVAQLQATRDAFVVKLLGSRLRHICNQLGEAFPALDLLGKDRDQQTLPL